MNVTHQELFNDLYISNIYKPEVYTNDEGEIVRRRQVKDIKHWEKLNEQLPRLRGHKEHKEFDPLADNVYAWSDLHFDHKNIIQYSNRPFGSKEHMNEMLLFNYKEIIKPDDIVIFGGDIAFTRNEELLYNINALPGYKIMIIGNHDIDKNGKMGRIVECFDEIHLTKLFFFVEKKWQLAFTHYPMRPEVPLRMINIHGHIHTHLTGHPQSVNMCVEHTDYRPKKVKDLVAPAFEMLKAVHDDIVF